jgi:hypothetical protein
VTTLTDLTRDTALLGGAGGLLYTATVTTVALISALSHDRRRRADARATLQLLLRRDRRKRS